LITSAANPRLRLVRKLHDRRWRDKLGLFAVEGEDLVEAGLAAGLEPEELFVAGENVSAEALASVSTLQHPPRRVAVFRRDDLPRLRDPGTRSVAVGLALWRVGDPGNLGTIMRAADGLGPAFVALSAGCADPTGPKALRGSMGAVFRVPAGRFEDAPGRRVALVARGGDPLGDVDLTGAVTFVLGAEREGLPESVASACDARASIELEPGAESLNVAVAAAIALYERRRRG
jgi:RNA methyltransferase, TrmH family